MLGIVTCLRIGLDRPGLASSFLAVLSLDLPCRILPCILLPCPGLPGLAAPCHAWPSLALPSLLFPHSNLLRVQTAHFLQARTKPHGQSDQFPNSSELEMSRSRLQHDCRALGLLSLINYLDRSRSRSKDNRCNSLSDASAPAWRCGPQLNDFGPSRDRSECFLCFEKHHIMPTQTEARAAPDWIGRVGLGQRRAQG